MDKYDENIKDIIETDGYEAGMAWWEITPLFAFVHPMRPRNKDCDDIYGCLTQIRSTADIFALDAEGAKSIPLTELITGDELIPLTPEGLGDDNLWLFAWWQRRIDRLYAGDLTIEQLAQELTERKEGDR